MSYGEIEEAGAKPAWGTVQGWPAARPTERTPKQAEPADPRCGRCGMTFRAGPPPGLAEAGPAESGRPGRAGGVEFLRCPECGRRFWADPRGTGGRCAVGIVSSPAPAAAIPGARP